MKVGRLLSFWEGIFSGAMLNFRGVTVVCSYKAKRRQAKKTSSPGVILVEHLNLSFPSTKNYMQRTKDHPLIGEGLHGNLH